MRNARRRGGRAAAFFSLLSQFPDATSRKPTAKSGKEQGKEERKRDKAFVTVGSGRFIKQRPLSPVSHRSSEQSFD